MYGSVSNSLWLTSITPLAFVFLVALVLVSVSRAVTGGVGESEEERGPAAMKWTLVIHGGAGMGASRAFTADLIGVQVIA